MARIDEVLKKLKYNSKNLKVVVLIDGLYYDVDVNNIRQVHVKREKDWTNADCYGIADENDEKSFEVLAIE